MANVPGASGGGSDTSSRRLRDDAESDPMNEQTEEVEVSGGSSDTSGGSSDGGSSSTSTSSNYRRNRDGTNSARESVTGTTSPTGDDVGSEDAQSTGESTTTDRSSGTDSGTSTSSNNGASGYGTSGTTDTTEAQSPQRQGRDGTNQTRETIGDVESDAGQRSPDAPERDRIKEEGIQGQDTGVEGPLDDDLGTGGAGVEESSDSRYQDEAEKLEQEVLEQNPALSDEGDVQVRKQGDQLVTVLTEQGKAKVRRRQAQEIEQEVVTGNEAIDSRDEVAVEFEDGQFKVRYTDRGKSAIEGYQRVEISQDIADKIEERTGERPRPGEDFSISFEDQQGRSPTAAERSTARRQRQVGAEDMADETLAVEQGKAVNIDISDDLQRQLDTAAAQASGAVSPGAPQRDALREASSSGNQRNGPSRTDDDIFSGAVRAAEDVTGLDVPGGGSVVNVAAQESPDLTANLGSFSDAGDYATREYNEFVTEYVQPVAEVGGDLADVAQSGARASTAARPGNLLAQRFGVETGADLETIEQETDTGEERVKDIARGEQKETTDSRLYERTGESGTRAALSLPGYPVALAGTGVDATEFVVKGSQRTIEGEGGEFAAEAGGQATLVGAQATKTAVENPGRTAGALAGSALATSSLIGGARALGGARAGKAASYGIQPGEELALAAARKGVPGARRVAGTVSDTSVGKGSNVDLTGPIRRSKQRISESTPNVSVRVTKAPNAPVLDVVSNTNVRQGIRSRARSSVESAQEIPSRARRRATTAQQQAQLDVLAGRQAVSDVGKRVRQAPSRARSRVEEQTASAKQKVSDGVERTSQQAQLDIASAEQSVREGVGRIRQAPQQAELGARRTARDIDETIGKLRGEIARRQSTGLLGDESTGRANPSTLIPNSPSFDGDVVSSVRNRAQSARFGVTQRVAGVEQRASSMAERARDAPSQARLKARRARRDVPEYVGNVRGEIARRKSTGLLGDESTARARPPIPSGLSRRFGGITDYTVRVDIGKPRRTNVDAADLEIDTTGTAKVDSPFEIGSGSDGSFESDFEANSGPQQAVAVERGRDTTTGKRTGTGTEFGAFGRLSRDLKTVETSLGDGQSANSPLEVGQAETTPQDLAPDTRVEPALGFEPAQGSDLATETQPTVSADSRVEPRSEPIYEDGFESDTQTESDLAVEQEQRQEVRTEAAVGGEPRKEGMIGGRKGSGGGDSFAGRRPGWAQRVERELRNPFTGR